MNKKHITVDLIEKTKFEEMVDLGLSDQELYEFFMVNGGALMQWVKLAYNTKHPLVWLKSMRVNAKAKFLKEQRKLAQKSHIASIWYGKNYYGQKEESVVEVKEQDFEDLSPLVDMLKEEPKDESNTDN